MLAKTLGPKWRGWSNGVVSLYAFGTAVSFMIIMVEELHRIADFVAPTPEAGADATSAPPVPWEENKRLLLVIVTAAIVYPLSCLRDLSMLRFTSVFGAFAAVYITTVVWVYAPWRSGGGDGVSMDVCHGGGGTHGSKSSDGLVTDGSESPAGFRLWPESAASISGAIPLLSFALNSGWAFVPIYSTMQNPTPRRGTTLITRAHAVGLCTS
jgi:amino acid permease